jgi:hypothetical protein
MTTEHCSMNASRGNLAAADSFQVGDSVFLRGCRVGKPGRVLRIERGKLVIYWIDLDFLSRHRPASLMHTDVNLVRDRAT